MTPLPDQDVICLDIARVKICSKIDLLDAYEQIHIIPEDMHKMVFATIYGMFMSNIMQQGNLLHPTSGTPRNSTGSEISDPLRSSD